MSKTTASATRARKFALMFGLACAMSVSLSAVEPAAAAINLSYTETASLQSSLSAAIAAAHGDPAAIENAIAEAVKNAVMTYGDDAASSITSVVITVGESSGATGDEIGIGLASASAALETTSRRAAGAIARTLANEGKTAEILAYQTDVDELGYSQLASIAGGEPSPTGETGGGLGSFNKGGGFNYTNGGGSGGGCLNPSCTKL